MSRWMRRIAYAVGTLVVIIAVLGGFVFAKSSVMLTKKYPVLTEPVTVVRDSAVIARGEHFATSIGKCVDCHGPDLGGKVFIDDPVLGKVSASNLTSGTGGVGTRYTDAGMAYTIRHGVKLDSTSALVMPSDEFQEMSDDDVAAIVAYVKSRPPVDRVLPKSFLAPVGRALVATGQLPIFAAEHVPADRPHARSVAPDSTAAYGQYLSTVGGCTGCHGPGLSGGKVTGTPPDWPPAANLTPKGIGRYTDAQLETILRAGTRPDGTKVNEVMPWRYTAMMTAQEMAATIKYLRSVPPKEFGNH